MLKIKIQCSYTFQPDKMNIFEKVRKTGNNLTQLTDEGMLAADGIAAELFSPLSPGGGT